MAKNASPVLTRSMKANSSLAASSIGQAVNGGGAVWQCGFGAQAPRLTLADYVKNPELAMHLCGKYKNRVLCWALARLAELERGDR